MVTVLAGRRIDPPEADAHRFPIANIPAVRERIRKLLAGKSTTLVCSAACGADLLALDEAGKLRIRRRIVLPFARERFRETSVVDRPGEWGAMFDRIMDEVERAADAVILPLDPDDCEAFTTTNRAILQEADAISREANQKILAVLVWDGGNRGGDDFTADFRDEVARRGYPVFEILTAGI